MTRLLIVWFFLGSAISFSRQKNKMLPMPPNCVWLYDSLWIDKTEIANIHWLEYLYYLEKDSAKEVLMKALPDETVWMDYDKTEKKQKITCARPTFVTTRWWGLVMSKRPNIVVGDQQG